MTESLNPERLFTTLPGTWILSRTLPGIGRMSGSANFTPESPGELHYREDGLLTLDNGHVQEAYREYRYLLEPGQIRICFAEPGVPPRTLHVLRLADSPRVCDVHLCGQDVYTGSYDFSAADQFVIDMRVMGPRKDYSIHTVYTRLT